MQAVPFFMNGSDQTPRFTLKKHERLKSRTSIKALFLTNKFLRVYPLKLVWDIIPEQEKSKVEFGVTVSKRQFKTAVDRNRIKRLVREAYRLNKHLLTDKIITLNIRVPIMFVYIGKEIESFQVIQKKLRHLLISLADKAQNAEKVC